MAKKETKHWVCYYRVSTQRQGESGLGLDAQKRAVEAFVQARGGTIVTAFTETESGKKITNRPQLQEALKLCRRTRATLVIAKLDRLARNVHFISGLLETGVDFLAVDQPTKDRFMLHLHAAFAEEEARRISIRTREALAAAKRRGVVIGQTGRALADRHKAAALTRAKQYSPIVTELRARGIIQVRRVRDELNRQGIASPAGARWHLKNVHKLLTRLKLLSSSHQ